MDYKKEYENLKEELRKAQYINTEILSEWKKKYKSKFFNCEYSLSNRKLKSIIKRCEGKHVQQIAYSSYHDSLTQICFGCRKIRTTMKESQVKTHFHGGKS